MVLCLFAVVIIGLFVWALIRYNNQNKLERVALSGIENIPEMKALMSDGTSVNLNDKLNHQKRTAILFFSPDCEYCKQEIRGIISRYSECRNVQWVFFTLAQPEEIAAFLNEYHILNIPYSYIIREDWPSLYKKLNIKVPPELFIYDEKGKLIFHHKGATSINTIVEELK